MKKILTMAVIVGAMLLGMNSCKKEVPAQSLTTEKTATVMVDSTLQLKANVTPTDATSTVKWASSDGNTATVDANGLVKGISDGECNIVASIDGLNATTKLTVIPTPATVDIEVTPMQTKAIVTMTPSTFGATFAFAYVDKAFADTKTDQELMDLLLNDEDFEDYLITPEDESYSSYLIMLTPGTEYTVLAFGYNEEYEIASKVLTRVNFKTNALAKTPTFEIEFDSIATDAEDTYAYFTITPSDNSKTYYAMSAKKSVIDQLGSPLTYLAYMDYMYLAYGLNLKNYVVKGEQVIYIKNPVESTEYQIIAAGYTTDWNSEPCYIDYTYEPAGAPVRLSATPKGIMKPEIDENATITPKHLLKL